MKPIKVCYQIHVSGKVQGVFFRASAKEEAEKLELAGYARNEADESVLIEVEGTKVNVNEFIRWCQSGPKYAEVSKVSTKEVPVQHYTTFSVL